MTYLERLTPWCIIRPFPNMRSQIVGRFRRRVDAEGHLQILKRMIPTVPFEIMFDVTPEHTEEGSRESGVGSRGSEDRPTGCKPGATQTKPASAG